MKRINKMEGIAPKNGPKNGIIFVTPIITLIKTQNGVPRRLVPMKQIKPIIMESKILPTKNPPNVLFANRTLLISRFAVSVDKKAYAIFLPVPQRFLCWIKYI